MNEMMSKRSVSVKGNDSDDSEIVNRRENDKAISEFNKKDSQVSSIRRQQAQTQLYLVIQENVKRKLMSKNKNTIAIKPNL